MVNRDFCTEGADAFVAKLTKRTAPPPSAKLPLIKMPFENLRVRLERACMSVSFSTVDRTGLFAFFTNLMGDKRLSELSIHSGFGTRLVGTNGSTFLITGPAEQLQTFTQTLEAAKQQVVPGEVVEVHDVFDVYFRAKDRPGLLRDFAKIVTGAGFNMAHLLITTHPSASGNHDWAKLYVQVEVPVGKAGKVKSVKAKLNQLSKWDPKNPGDAQFENLPEGIRSPWPTQRWPKEWDEV